MRKLLFSVFLLLAVSLKSQSVDINRSLWTRISETQVSVSATDRQIVPNVYLTYELNIELMRTLLATAPKYSDILHGEADPLLIEIPGPDGLFDTYKIWDFEIMHPDLQAEFPQIRSFEGVSMTNPAARVFFDFTQRGFHSMTLNTPGGSVFIDPYSKADDVHYVVYFKKDFVKKEADRMVCLVKDDVEEPKLGITEFPAANCTKRREYRLAMAATGEYTAFHGGTVVGAMAAINTSMTRVNGVYVNEFSVKMNLIATNSSVVYTNGATDPFTNNDGVAMLTENQNNMTSVIGSANYDIGHIFSTNGGGVAMLNSPCNASTKARGVTGTSSPVGDPFDIDYVAHEIGHQYGCSHTFASSSGSCSGNGTSASAFEPGSGTTIMAYAGICSPQNVQNNSDPYFHARSLLQASNFITPGTHTCDNEINSGNLAPTVAAFTPVTFPKSTPFVLTGSATDPNSGQALTYCWEQYNNALVTNPSSSNTTGPLFRSLSAVPETYRYFPSFDNTFNNSTDTWELLPSVARTLTFRLTARDNDINGGCSHEQDITVTIDNNGPFTLSTPNGGVALTGNSTYAVTWNVAGTNTATPNVDILYSTNPSDPTTYVMLVANTPNDGTQNVTIPNITTTTFRMMVRSASTNGIFFFDISNANNSVTFSVPVELTVFKAVKNVNQVDVSWQTATEVNNKGFDIQRSVNNNTFFETIGWVDAAPNGRVVNQYTFTDVKVKPGNTYNYRLQQTDLDGKSELSDIRSVEFDGISKQLNIAPNPAKDYVLLNATGTDVEDIFEITVYNDKGQVVAQRNMSLNNAIPTNDWAAGVYWVRAVSGGRIWSGKVVK